MEISNRVQIVPFGYERARVLEPVYEYYADTVVLIRRNEADDFEAPFQREVVDELRDNDRITLEIRHCDIFDFDDSLNEIKAAIRSHADGEVYVNLSTGTKITAIASVVACQTEGGTPFYVTPEFRNEEGELEPPDTPVVEFAGAVVEIPIFGLEQPPRHQLETLEFLRREDGATKKALIQFAESRAFPFIADSTSETEEGRYKLIENHLIRPLTERDFVRVEAIGRTKRVSLEERGLQALRIFSPSIDATNTDSDQY